LWNGRELPRAKILSRLAHGTSLSKKSAEETKAGMETVRVELYDYIEEHFSETVPDHLWNRLSWSAFKVADQAASIVP